jgi:hypothetical protein
MVPIDSDRIIFQGFTQNVLIHFHLSRREKGSEDPCGKHPKTKREMNFT